AAFACLAFQLPHHFQGQHLAITEAGFHAGPAAHQPPAALLVPVIHHRIDHGKERIIGNVRTGHGSLLEDGANRSSSRETAIFLCAREYAPRASGPTVWSTATAATSRHAAGGTAQERAFSYGHDIRSAEASAMV